MSNPRATSREPSGTRATDATSAIALLLLPLLASACAGTSGGREKADARPRGAEKLEEPFVPLTERAGGEERSLGKYLSDLDAAIRAWSAKTWAAATDADRRKQHQLELYLGSESKKRQDELVEQLESGPLRNRVIAATALGFTRDPAMLSPLLAALGDPEPDVVKNALVGLSLLQSKATPLSEIVPILVRSSDADLRANAAYCIRCLLEIGATGEGLGEAARGGSVDPDALVRSQSALILALVRDPDAVPALVPMLSDEVELVSAAAARALARYGQEVPDKRGEAARALTAALEKAKEPRLSMLVRNLAQMSTRNYGKDVEAWVSWSQRLP